MEKWFCRVAAALFVCFILFYVKPSIFVSVNLCSATIALWLAAETDVRQNIIPNSCPILLIALYLMAKILHYMVGTRGFSAAWHSPILGASQGIPITVDVFAAICVVALLLLAEWFLRLVHAHRRGFSTPDLEKPESSCEASYPRVPFYIGGGDVKLLFATTLYIGAERALVFLAAASVFGLMWGLWRKGPYPWGPGIALAAWLVLALFG